jgi:hypothetical protein
MSVNVPVDSGSSVGEGVAGWPSYLGLIFVG